MADWLKQNLFLKKNWEPAFRDIAAGWNIARTVDWFKSLAESLTWDFKPSHFSLKLIPKSTGRKTTPSTSNTLWNFIPGAQHWIPTQGDNSFPYWLPLRPPGKHLFGLIFFYMFRSVARTNRNTFKQAPALFSFLKLFYLDLHGEAHTGVRGDWVWTSFPTHTSWGLSVVPGALVSVSVPNAG